MAYIKVYKDSKNEFRWKMIADNNTDVIADSGEGYKQEADCLHGIDLVQASSSYNTYKIVDEKWYVWTPNGWKFHQDVKKS